MLEEFIQQASIYSPLIPLLLGGLYFHAWRHNSSARMVYALIAVLFASEFIAIYFIRIMGNNMIWFHTLYSIQAALLVAFFYYSSPNGKIIAWLGALTIASVLLYDFSVGFLKSNTVEPITYSIFFLALGLHYFYSVYQKESIEHLNREFTFWIVCALLIYFSMAFFTFLTYMTLKTWALHNAANVIKNILFSVGFYVTTKK